MTPQQPEQPLQGMQPVPPQEEQEAVDPQEQMENVVNSALSQINIAKKIRNRKVKDTDTLVLTEMGEKIVKGYEADEESRKEWSKRNVEWRRMALLTREPKTWPWPKASNVKYPLLSTAAMQFSARAYPALVPSDGKVVKTRLIPFDPQGKLAKQADHISKHMSYQVMCKMPNWETDMDKLLITMAISGLCFKKTYHDSVMKVHRSDLVYPENLVINYWAKDLCSAYRKTELLYYTDNEIKEKQNNDEEFLDIELLKSDLSQNSAENLTKKIATGNVAPQLDASTPHNFLDCHTFWDLDDDGYEEPYIITVHKDTKKVVRIIARWDLDGIKRDAKDKVLLIKPLEYFTAFPFIPNPDGSIYALGFGLLLGPLNESINSILNQLIDSGTLHNLQSGFIGKGLRLKMGTNPFTPGEWKAVNATGDDLNKQIVPLPSKEPSAVLMSLVQMLITSGNQLASIAEIMVGKLPGQNTPAGTTQEAVKQGMAVFTAIYKRVYRALDEEFKKLFRLNRITDGILEEENEILGLQLTSSDYDEDTLIIPGGDPTGDSGVEKAGKIQQVGAMLQLGTIDPMAFTKWALEEGQIPNYQALLKQPAPPPPPDPSVLTEQEKQKTEQLKQHGMQQKQAGEAVAQDQDLRYQQALSEIKMNQEEQKLSHKKTLEAMDQQGKQFEGHMNMLKQVLDQHAAATKAVQEVQHTTVVNRQAEEHAQKLGKIKQQQAAKPKPAAK